MSYYDNMENACRARGYTLSQVLRAIGKNRSSVGAWKGGSMPSIEACDLIAQYLGITIDELVNGSDHEAPVSLPVIQEGPTITRDEQEWLNLYHQIPKGKRYAFKIFLLQMVPDTDGDVPPSEEKGEEDELSAS